MIVLSTNKTQTILSVAAHLRDIERQLTGSLAEWVSLIGKRRSPLLKSISYRSTNVCFELVRQPIGKTFVVFEQRVRQEESICRSFSADDNTSGDLNIPEWQVPACLALEPTLSN